MAYLLQQLANAVPLCALYAALAFGYAIGFGVTRRADITYGAPRSEKSERHMFGMQ